MHSEKADQMQADNPQQAQPYQQAQKAHQDRMEQQQKQQQLQQQQQQQYLNNQQQSQHGSSSNRNSNGLAGQDQENKASNGFEENQLVYFDQMEECQEFVMEECLDTLAYANIQKILPTQKLTKYNQALLTNIVKQVFSQVHNKLKRNIGQLQEKHKIKDRLVDIQKVKQQQQVITSLGYTDNIVDQDENQVFFEILLKNMKLYQMDADITSEQTSSKNVATVGTGFTPASTIATAGAVGVSLPGQQQGHIQSTRTVSTVNK